MEKLIFIREDLSNMLLSPTLKSIDLIRKNIQDLELGVGFLSYKDLCHERPVKPEIVGAAGEMGGILCNP